MSAYKFLEVVMVVCMLNMFSGCAKAPQKVSEATLEELEELPVAAKEDIYPQMPQPKETRLSVLKEKIKEHLPARKISVPEKTAVAKAPPRHLAPAKDIQTALKNAGYYTGNIDGKIGTQTGSAIKAFQKDNGLKADGVVGQRTWNLLSKYLTPPSPAAATVPSEVFGEKKPGGVVTITPSTTAEVSTAPLEQTTDAVEMSSTVEEAPAAERNFRPLIIIAIIVLVIVLAVSIYRRRQT